MRYSGGDPNLGNTGGLGHQIQEDEAAMMRMIRFNPVSPQKQINQFDKLDAIRSLGNMSEAQKNGFVNKFVY